MRIWRNGYLSAPMRAKNKEDEMVRYSTVLTLTAVLACSSDKEEELLFNPILNFSNKFILLKYLFH